jgi:hypothetical protein
MGFVATLFVGLGIGIAIGRASSPPAAPVVAPVVDTGHLDVSSKPIDGNVVVDGRFVGVAPVERVDVEPGKHSIVIDAFGYQPYAGTLEIGPRGQINLHVTLAPIGGDGSSTGNVSGTGKATTTTVPATALLPPVTAPRAPIEPVHPAAAPRRPAPPPERPRRDCDGEKRNCRNSCDHAGTDCDFSCPYCSGCNTSMTDDDCRRQCATCRQSCSNNKQFCESSCDNQSDSCNASQP